MTDAAAPFPSLSERFATAIALLSRVFTVLGPRYCLQPSRLPAIQVRVQRLGERFLTMLAAINAGKLPVVRKRAKAAARPVTDAVPRKRPVLDRSERLLGFFGWLPVLIHHAETSAARSQLRDWIADPEVTRLAETAPQVGRVLRPLCHMLGIVPPPALRLPKRVRVRKPRDLLLPPVSPSIALLMRGVPRSKWPGWALGNPKPEDLAEWLGPRPGKDPPPD